MIVLTPIICEKDIVKIAFQSFVSNKTLGAYYLGLSFRALDLITKGAPRLSAWSSVTQTIEEQLQRYAYLKR